MVQWCSGAVVQWWDPWIVVSQLTPRFIGFRKERLGDSILLFLVELGGYQRGSITDAGQSGKAM